MQPIKFNRYFPETRRAFADGELALTMDRYGGILELSWIDVLHTAERDYCDNSRLPLLSRNATTASGRPLFGPGIYFLSESEDGRLDYHTPFAPSVYPWAVTGNDGLLSYGMVMDGDCIRFRLGNKSQDRRLLRIVISKLHFFNGTCRTNKNQRAEESSRMIAEAMGSPFSSDVPVQNGLVELSWSKAELLSDACGIGWRCGLSYPYGKKELHLVLVTSSPFVLEESPSAYSLTMQWRDNDVITASLALGLSNEEAIEKSVEGGIDFTSVLERKIARIDALVANAPSIDIEGRPLAGVFMRDSVAYMDSLLLKHVPGAIRAAQFKYAQFMMWDSLYPIRDLLNMGNVAKAKDIFRSFLGYPYIECSAWIVSQLCIVLDEIYAFTQDDAFLVEVWPAVKDYVNWQLKLTDGKTGLLASTMTVGVDLPQELGLSGLYYAPCINGWWYNAVRVIENMAGRFHEREMQKRMREIADKIDKSFLDAFLGEEVPYLRSGVPLDGLHSKNNAFQNTSTIALDYPMGQYLLRNAIVPLAQYQCCHLRHPAGHSSVSWNTEILCEMWKNVHMNQHLAHEGLLQRLAGNMPEAYRLLDCFLEDYSIYGTAIETQNFSGCLGDESQNSDWQAFAATSICEMLRTAMAGVGRHCGGLFYIPADDEHEIRLGNLKCFDTAVNIVIRGKGPFWAQICVNGMELKVTAQLPRECFDGKILNWEIIRGDGCPSYPVLLNSYGLLVSNVSIREHSLSLNCEENGHYPMEFLAKANAKATLNSKCIRTEVANGHLYLDVDVKCGDTIAIMQ